MAKASGRALLFLVLGLAAFAAAPAPAQPAEEGEDEVQATPDPEALAGLPALGIVAPGGGLFRLDPRDPVGPVALAALGEGATLVPGVVSVMVLPDRDAEGNDVAIETLELAYEGLELLDCTRDALPCLGQARTAARRGVTLVALDATAAAYGFAGVQRLRGARRGRDLALATLRVTGLDAFALTDEAGARYTGTWERRGRRGRRFRLHLDAASEARLGAKLGGFASDEPTRVTLRMQGGAAGLMLFRRQGADPATGEPLRYRARLRGALLP